MRSTLTPPNDTASQSAASARSFSEYASFGSPPYEPRLLISRAGLLRRPVRLGRAQPSPFRVSSAWAVVSSVKKLCLVSIPKLYQSHAPLKSLLGRVHEVGHRVIRLYSSFFFLGVAMRKLWRKESRIWRAAQSCKFYRALLRNRSIQRSKDAGTIRVQAISVFSQLCPWFLCVERRELSSRDAVLWSV